MHGDGRVVMTMYHVQEMNYGVVIPYIKQDMGKNVVMVVAVLSREKVVIFVPVMWLLREHVVQSI